MLQSNINWGQYSDDRQRAYDRLAQTRQQQLDAEVKAHNEKAAQGSDSQQLGALAVQGGLAYATGGASLAFAPMIDKASWTAMGKPQAAGTGISGAASSLGQMGYGLASANKAEALAAADKAHEASMARQEQRFNTIAKYDPKQAMAMIPEIDAQDRAFQQDRKSFVEGSKTGSGFLDNLLQKGKVESSYTPGQAQKINLQQYTDQGASEPTAPASQGMMNLDNEAEMTAIEDQLRTDQRAKEVASSQGGDPTLVTSDASDAKILPTVRKAGTQAATASDGTEMVHDGKGGIIPKWKYTESQGMLTEGSKKIEGDALSRYRFY